jgi:hypothetical protein
MGVSSTGKLYFTANRGSNNGSTILLFIKKLVIKLDLEDPEWRDNTILLIDNAPYHKGFRFREKMK